MRDYLFRGKRKDNGEWVEGCGIIATENWVSIFTVIDDIDENSSEVNEIEVLPSTVGQYTGLTDKNGKKIFEGDIVKIIDDYDYIDIEVVKWSENDAGFFLEINDYYVEFDRVVAKECEVIGNIYNDTEER